VYDSEAFPAGNAKINPENIPEGNKICCINVMFLQ